MKNRYFLSTFIIIVLMAFASCSTELINGFEPAYVPDSTILIEDLGASSVDFSAGAGYEVELVVKNAVMPNGTGVSIGGQVLGEITGGAASYFGSDWGAAKAVLQFEINGGTGSITFAVQPSSGFENWGRTWVSADKDVAFALFEKDDWGRFIYCWDDVNDGKDGNFFIDFGSIPTGHKVRITIDCAKSQDI